RAIDSSPAPTVSQRITMIHQRRAFSRRCGNFVSAQFVLSLSLLASHSGNAHATATALAISDCGPAPPPPVICPASAFPYVVGEPLEVWVSAIDAHGRRDYGYTGIVSFTSSDPEAKLPP